MAFARAALLPACGIAVLLASCRPVEEAPPELVRPVRTVTVEKGSGGETATLTGQIAAQEEVSLAFRVGGRMIERSVNVGDLVKAGQIIARVEADPAQNALQAARADVAAAAGQLAEARLAFDRQQAMLERGVTPRAMFDRAQQERQTAQARVDAAQARLNNARDQLSYTELVADSAGSVTEVGAEPGEVVAAGRMIVQLARKGGRDAVFAVPARLIQAAPLDPVVKVSLSTDASVRATGRVREVAPQADPVTRTFRVRVGLGDPPEAMRLGSTVNGTIHLGETAGIEIPASALTAANGRSAVWIVDPASNTVSLRNIDVQRYGIAGVEVAQGLEPDDIVVTAGVQALRPGQKVRLLQAAQ